MEVFVVDVVVNDFHLNHVHALFKPDTIPSLYICEMKEGIKAVKTAKGLGDILELTGESMLGLVSRTPATIDANVRLLCLDVDSTIVSERDSTKLISQFRDLLRSLDPTRIKIALVSNQGGVGLRRWMEQGHWGEPHNLPTQAQVEARMETIVTEIKTLFRGDVSVYVAFRYKTAKGKISPRPAGTAADARWEENWRKPNPGMLLKAMEDSGVSATERLRETLFIGDQVTDQEAAERASVAFMFAKSFFYGDPR